MLSGRIIHEESPQNYKVNQFFFPKLFSNTDATNVAQRSAIKDAILWL